LFVIPHPVHELAKGKGGGISFSFVVRRTSRLVPGRAPIAAPSFMPFIKFDKLIL
jgi:hypothetical protein